MQTYSIQDLEIKIKSTEEKYQKQSLRGADRALLTFLKSQIEYLKRLREEMIGPAN
jgi:hypothetical protein